MISIIYGGNQSGAYFDLYQSILQKLNKANTHILKRINVNFY